MSGPCPSCGAGQRLDDGSYFHYGRCVNNVHIDKREYDTLTEENKAFREVMRQLEHVVDTELVESVACMDTCSHATCQTVYDVFDLIANTVRYGPEYALKVDDTEDDLDNVQNTED